MIQLDKQTIDDINFEIRQMLDDLEDFSILEDYWMAVTRPEYPVKELRRVDINIYDTAMFGDEGDTGLKCAVYIVDDNLDIDYENPILHNCDHLEGIDPQTNVQKRGN